MIVSEIELFEILSQQLGAEKAKSLVHYVEAKVDRRLEDKTSVFSTKEDLSKLEVKMTDIKAEIIKWMFIFWVGQMAATIAIVKLLH